MPYFDAASAAPLHPVARQALLASLDEGWADPARLYREGRRARLLLDAAREAAAEAVGCRPDELVFTPSGTRAVHAGISGSLAGRRRVGNRIVVSAVEHSSVLHAAESHTAAGGTLTEVPVARSGAVDTDVFAAALDSGTALACLQSANHEVGTAQPVAEVAEACRAAGVPLLVDAAQSLGWGSVEGGWSLLAASAHKWGGPAGVGLLAVRKGVRFAPQGPSDERESGRAPGFENLPAIVAAAASLRAVRAEAATEGRGCGPWWTGSGHGCRSSYRTWRWWATRCAGSPISSRSPVSMSTGRPCCTSWTGRVSPFRPVHRVRVRR